MNQPLSDAIPLSDLGYALYFLYSTILHIPPHREPSNIHANYPISYNLLHSHSQLIPVTYLPHYEIGTNDSANDNHSYSRPGVWTFFGVVWAGIPKRSIKIF